MEKTITKARRPRRRCDAKRCDQPHGHLGLCNQELFRIKLHQFHRPDHTILYTSCCNAVGQTCSVCGGMTACGGCGSHTAFGWLGGVPKHGPCVCS